MSDQTADPWDIKPFTLMLMSDLQSGATETAVYHAAEVDAARQQVDAHHAAEIADCERQIDAACVDIEALRAQRSTEDGGTTDTHEVVQELRDTRAERDDAQQEIQTLQEGLTWALDALEEMMRNSPTPPLTSEAPMTEIPTDVTATLARPMRVALAAYYDAKRALAQTKADDAALMARTVRVLTDAEVIDKYYQMLGRR